MLDSTLEALGIRTAAGDRLRAQFRENFARVVVAPVEQRLVGIHKLIEQSSQSVFLRSETDLISDLYKWLAYSVREKACVDRAYTALEEVAAAVRPDALRNAAAILSQAIQDCEAIKSSAVPVLKVEARNILDKLDERECADFLASLGRLDGMANADQAKGVERLDLELRESLFVARSERIRVALTDKRRSIAQDGQLLAFARNEIEQQVERARRRELQLSEWRRFRTSIEARRLPAADLRNLVNKINEHESAIAEEQTSAVLQHLNGFETASTSAQVRMLEDAKREMNTASFASNRSAATSTLYRCEGIVRDRLALAAQVEVLLSEAEAMQPSQRRQLDGIIKDANALLERLPRQDAEGSRAKLMAVQERAYQLEGTEIRCAIADAEGKSIRETRIVVDRLRHLIANSTFYKHDRALEAELNRILRRADAQAEALEAILDRARSVSTSAVISRADAVVNIAMLGLKLCGSELHIADRTDAEECLKNLMVSTGTRNSAAGRTTDLQPFHAMRNYALPVVGKQFRPQQMQYALACFEAVSGARDIVIEGPTGLGKTRALLAAVLPWLERSPANRLVYATRTVTQVANVLREVADIVREADGTLDWLTATLHVGVSRLIENTACHSPTTEEVERKCDTCRYQRTRSSGRNALNANFVLGFEEIRDQISRSHICASTLMEAATREAKIVIMPHGYLANEQWKIDYALANEETVLVVDEAHNFFADAASKPFLSLRWLQADRNQFDERSDLHSNRINLRQLLEEVYPKAAAALRGTDNRRESILEKLYERLTEASRSLSLSERLQEFVPLLGREGDKRGVLVRDVTSVVSALVEACSAIEGSGALQDVFDGLDDKLEVMRRPGPRKNILAFVATTEHLSKRVERIAGASADFYAEAWAERVDFFSIPPMHEVACAAGRFRTRIFTSATMRPVDTIARLTKLTQPLAIDTPHVFPPENYLTFYVAGYHSGDTRSQDGELQPLAPSARSALAATLRNAIEAARGRNVGVFVNNARNIPMVVEMLTRICSEGDLILGVLPGKLLTPEAKRANDVFDKGYEVACELLGIIREAKNRDFEQKKDVRVSNVFIRLGGLHSPRPTVILVGVQGGSLAEGVDYRGPAMEMVVNIGLPYPQAQEEQFSNLKSEYWLALMGGDRGIADDLSFRQEAFRKLAQAVGRSHRTPDDRAVVVFVDERLLAVKGFQRLNAANAIRNHDILQLPTRLVIDGRMNARIVLAASEEPDRRATRTAIEESLRPIVSLTDADFASVSEMKEAISAFLGKKESIEVFPMPVVSSGCNNSQNRG